MPDDKARTAASHTSPENAYESAKLGIWIFLATEVLLFGGLFTAYAVYRYMYPEMFHEEHLKLDRVLGGVNTVVLICSSLTVALGIAAIRRGRVRTMKLMYALTLLFAAGFLSIKYFEYSEKFHHGITPATNIFFSLYFMLTGLHGLHVIAGMIVLTTVLVMAHMGRFDETYNTPVEISGIYWHFVDVVWIYLFPLLYLVG